MTNLWNLLPPALVTRAKTVLAVIGAAAYVAVSYFPSLADNHWVAVTIGILTVLGVYVVPNFNARSVDQALHAQDRMILPDRLA